MSGLLRDGTVAWQSLLPERFGEATVSVRLEELSGDLIIGRQINVRVRTKYLERIRNFSSVTANLIGIIGISLGIFIKKDKLRALMNKVDKDRQPKTEKPPFPRPPHTPPTPALPIPTSNLCHTPRLLIL